MFTTFEQFKSATSKAYIAIRSNPSMKLSVFRDLFINNSEYLDLNTYKTAFTSGMLDKQKEEKEISNLDIVDLIKNNAILMMETNMFIDTSYVYNEYFNINFSDEIGNEYNYELEISKIKHKYYGEGKFGIWDEENLEFEIKIFSPYEINKPLNNKNNEIDKLKATIAVLRQGLVDIEIASDSTNDNYKCIGDKATSLLKETNNICIKT